VRSPFTQQRVTLGESLLDWIEVGLSAIGRPGAIRRGRRAPVTAEDETSRGPTCEPSDLLVLESQRQRDQPRAIRSRWRNGKLFSRAQKTAGGPGPAAMSTSPFAIVSTIAGGSL